MTDEQLTLFYLDLTRLQRRILQLACDGLTNPEIAACLSIQPSVVREYLSVIYALLGSCDAYAHLQPNRYVLISAFAPFFQRYPNLRTVKPCRARAT